MLCRATQDKWVMVESSDKTQYTGEVNGKPFQYSCLEKLMNSMKRQKEMTLKDEPPRSDQFSSVIQSCLTLNNHMDCSPPGLPVHHQLPEFTQTHVHWVGDAIWPSHPLSSLSPPAFNLSRHQGLFNKSALRIRWPKDWSFSFNISPSNEHSGLISFMMNWMDLLAVQGTLESFPISQFKSIKSSVLSFLHSPTLTSIHDHWKNHSRD